MYASRNCPPIHQAEEKIIRKANRKCEDGAEKKDGPGGKEKYRIVSTLFHRDGVSELETKYSGRRRPYLFCFAIFS